MACSLYIYQGFTHLRPWCLVLFSGSSGSRSVPEIVLSCCSEIMEVGHRAHTVPPHGH